jgi:hypothetical protein
MPILAKRWLKHKCCPTIFAAKSSEIASFQGLTKLLQGLAGRLKIVEKLLGN